MAGAAAAAGISIGGPSPDDSGIKKPEVVSQGGSMEMIKDSQSAMKKFGKSLGGLFGKKKSEAPEAPESTPLPPLPSKTPPATGPGAVGSKNDNVLSTSMPPPPTSSKPGGGPVPREQGQGPQPAAGQEGTFSLGENQQGSI
jgi:hypothetical protein